MRLILPRELTARLKVHLRRAGRREIGGLMMAEQIEPGFFRLHDITVNEHSGSDYHFDRRILDHRAALSSFFSQTGNDFARFNYLGEWHSHPSFDLSPSRTDIDAMRQLVQEPSLGFAALMIVRLRYFLYLSVHAEFFKADGSHAQVTLQFE